MTTPNLTQLMAASEEHREGLGVFATNDELEKAVMTPPLAALAKCLGIRLAAGPALRSQDDQALQNRCQAYGITRGVR